MKIRKLTNHEIVLLVMLVIAIILFILSWDRIVTKLSALIELYT